MLDCEAGIKWLGPKAGDVVGESGVIHEGHGAQPADVPVDERPARLEGEDHRDVSSFLLRQSPVVDEYCPGEPRLYARVQVPLQVENDQLRPSPAAADATAADPLRENRRRYLTKDVAMDDPDRNDRVAADRGVQIARDRLGLGRSEEHTSELQSRFGISYAVFCLKKK